MSTAGWVYNGRAAEKPPALAGAILVSLLVGLAHARTRDIKRILGISPVEE